MSEIHQIERFLSNLSNKDWWPILFWGKTVTGLSYLEMLQSWLFHNFMTTLMISIPTRRSPATLAQQRTAIPEWHTTSTLDRAHGTPRHCPTLLASKIFRHYPMRLLLMRIRKKPCFCPTVSSWPRRAQKQDISSSSFSRRCYLAKSVGWI